MFAPKQQKNAGHHPNNQNSERKPFVLQRQGENAGIQENLKVGRKDDAFEKEADSVADTVTSKSETPNVEVAPTRPIQTMTVGSGDLAQREPEEDVQMQEEEVQLQSESESESEVHMQEEEEVQMMEDESVETQAMEEDASSTEMGTDESDNVQMQSEMASATEMEPAVQAKSDAAETTQLKAITPEPPKAVPAPTVQLQAETSSEEDLQMKEDEEMTEEADNVQMKSSTMDSGEDVSSQINNAKGGGSPLDEVIKADMESGFGYDFSDIRIHTDNTAAELNKTLGARAFTTGNDIFFNDGEYDPETQDGKHLLAHELTHTIQQGHAGVSIQRLDDPELINERTELYKEVGTLWSLTNRLQSESGDDSYNLRNLQKAFFEKGTSFSGKINADGGIPGLWPNLVLIYYLVNRAWTTSDPFPQVKSQLVDGKLVVLSEFQGHIIMAADVKGEFQGERRNIQTITVYNHIGVNGLKAQAEGGFYIANTVAAFDSLVASTPETFSTLISEYRDTGEVRSMGYRIAESQFNAEYQLLRDNGYDKSLSEYRQNPISLREHLEGGKDFKWVKKPGIVDSTGGVQLRKAPFTEKDVMNLKDSYKGPSDLKIKILPFNTTFTAYRETTDPNEKWAYIKTDKGERGYISMVYATLDVPHAGAFLHHIKEEETKSSIARKYRDWIITEDFVLAIEHFNPTIKGKKLTPGHRLWIPTIEKAKQYILSLPKSKRKTRTPSEYQTAVAKKIYAIKTRESDVSMYDYINSQKNVDWLGVERIYDKKYRKSTDEDNFYEVIYKKILGNEEKFKAFEIIVDKHGYEHHSIKRRLFVTGIDGHGGEDNKGGSFRVKLIRKSLVSEFGHEMESVQATGTSSPGAKKVLWKAPGTSVRIRSGKIVFIDITESKSGYYDFIFFYYPHPNKLIPLRIRHRIISVSDMRANALSIAPALEYDDYLMNLEYTKIQIAGGVTKEQGKGIDPHIVMTGRNNPSEWGDASRFVIESTEPNVTYDWYAHQLTFGLGERSWGWPISGTTIRDASSLGNTTWYIKALETIFIFYLMMLMAKG